ncbi:MAG: NAD(P)-dependent oxidoreductase [Lentisphaerota bacterium]
MITHGRKARKTMPVALLVEGRRCLVIGGGTVAGRKAGALLEAGAEVMLVAPEIGDYTEGLIGRLGLQIARRKYAPIDLDGKPFVVIAATDDPGLNRSILEDCHARGVLCACPDRGWEDGDFISPASFKHGDLTVSVSTGGASCRRARLIKESLSRHAEALGQSDLLVVGTDHRLVNLAGRESLHLSGAHLDETTAGLRQILGLHEFMIVNTCNRMEVVGLGAITPALIALVSRVLGLASLEARCSYAHCGKDAFRHVALVAAGLLSQTPRETHIRAQIKDALALSHHNGWSAGILHDWVGRALRIGNAIHRATGDILAATEIEDRCLTYLTDILGDLRTRRVLVIGAGVVGRSLVQKLLDLGSVVSCCTRAQPPAFMRAGLDTVTWYPQTQMREALGEQDAVICATAGKDPILTAAHASWIAPNHSLVIVDLGVPRNVAPDFAAGRDSLRVANLDDLNHESRSDTGALQQALVVGDRIICEHIGEYNRVCDGIHTGD